MQTTGRRERPLRGRSDRRALKTGRCPHLQLDGSRTAIGRPTGLPRGLSRCRDRSPNLVRRAAAGRQGYLPGRQRRTAAGARRRDMAAGRYRELGRRLREARQIRGVHQCRGFRGLAGSHHRSRAVPGTGRGGAGRPAFGRGFFRACPIATAAAGAGCTSPAGRPRAAHRHRPLRRSRIHGSAGRRARRRQYAPAVVGASRLRSREYPRSYRRRRDARGHSFQHPGVAGGGQPSGFEGTPVLRGPWLFPARRGRGRAGRVRRGAGAARCAPDFEREPADAGREPHCGRRNRHAAGATPRPARAL